MNKIGVLGMGTMGVGIVQVLAQNGYEVYVRARKEATLEKGMATIEKSLSKLVAKEKITEEEKAKTLSKITTSTELKVVRDCELIIEAAVEDIESKKALFKELDEIVGEDTILATNTSSLSITEIASVVSHPENVVGMHFFNPVPVMKLIEVIRGLVTANEVRDKIFELSEKIGKTPVEVHEAPGFVVNRILIPMINEAVGILAEGFSDAKGIDTAMKLGANHPMGPLELGDLIGLDVCLAIMETLYSEFGDPKYRPHILLKKMVRGGKLGRKTKEGFYKYE